MEYKLGLETQVFFSFQQIATEREVFNLWKKVSGHLKWLD